MAHVRMNLIVTKKQKNMAYELKEKFGLNLSHLMRDAIEKKYKEVNNPALKGEA